MEKFIDNHYRKDNNHRGSAFIGILIGLILGAAALIPASMQLYNEYNNTSSYDYYETEQCSCSGSSYDHSYSVDDSPTHNYNRSSNKNNIYFGPQIKIGNGLYMNPTSGHISPFKYIGY